jgi:hypothetical protein
MGYGVNEKDALHDRPLIIHASNVLSRINTALGKAGSNDHYADAPKERKEATFKDNTPPKLSKIVADISRNLRRANNDNSSIGVPRLTLEQEYRIRNRRSAGNLVKSVISHRPHQV